MISKKMKMIFLQKQKSTKTLKQNMKFERKSIALVVVISKILFIKNTSILQPHINVLCGKRLAVAGM